MAVWVIEPRDPLVVRDGRPFGPSPGAQAETQPFPFPSTLAGGVRTRAGRGADGVFDPTTENIERVKRIGIRGPLLLELDDASALRMWFAPAPADAVVLGLGFERMYEGRLVPLVPVDLDEDHADVMNLPDGLRPVAMTAHDPSKPRRDAPRFWTWPRFAAWLTEPTVADVQLADLGIPGPAKDRRVHVRIAPATLTADEGALFLTNGLTFSHRDGSLGATRRLGLAVITDADLAEGLAPLGGERRIVQWRALRAGDTPFPPPCPPDVRAAIARDRACRLVLLTPAAFAAGYVPTEALAALPSGATVRAAAVRGPDVVSGWDMAAPPRGRPKPTRRLVPAGSVYWLSMNAATPDEIDRWIDDVWFANISDASPDDRRDGFGLAVLGTWDGELKTMEAAP